jgi:TolA-binding protein
MKTKIVTTLLIFIGFTAPVQAENIVVRQQKKSPCTICLQIIADADARQQRQQDRQQRLQQQQERQQERQQLLQQQQQQRQQERQQRLEQNQERVEQFQQQRRDNQRHPIRVDYWLFDNWQQPYQDSWRDYNPEQYNYPRNTVEDNLDVSPTDNKIKVDLISQTQDKVTVLIEGEKNQKTIVFNENKTKQTVYLAPGNYKLWFNNASGKSWTHITLKVGEVNPVKITFQKDNPLLQVNNSCMTSEGRDCPK